MQQLRSPPKTARTPFQNPAPHGRAEFLPPMFCELSEQSPQPGGKILGVGQQFVPKGRHSNLRRSHDEQRGQDQHVHQIDPGAGPQQLGSAAGVPPDPAALLGVAVHYTVALGIVTTYVLVSRALPALNRRPFVYGPLYGIAAYLVMNFVVIPMSAIGTFPRFNAFGTTNGVLIHMIGVGLPTALIAARVRRS